MRIFRYAEDLELTEDGVGTKKKYILDAGIDWVVPDNIPAVIKKNRGEKHIIRNDNFYPFAESKKYSGEDLTGKKIILFRNGGIGDLIFAVPALIEYKKKYKDIHITFCCNSAFSPIFEEVDCIDKILHLPIKLSDIIENDYFINFEGSIEGNKDAEIYNAYDLYNKRFFIEPEVKCPVLKVNKEKEDLIKRAFIDPYPDYKKVVIAYASSVPIRSVAPYTWMNLIDSLADRKIKFFIVGSPSQVNAIDEMIAPLNNKANCINFCGDKQFANIQYTVALINNCDVVISPDSGLLHIAGGLGKSMIGLFGAFHTDLRLKYYKNAIGVNAMTNCVYAKGEYKSCFMHGDGSCPLANLMMEVYSPCMKFITHQHVINAMLKLKIIEVKNEN